MADITIRAHEYELGLHRDELHALRAELAARGHEVHFARPERIEYRGGGIPPDLGDVGVIAIVIYVGKKLAGETVDDVLEQVRVAVLSKLRGLIRIGPRKGESRVVVIFDHRGEKLDEVEVPADDE